MSDTFSLFVKAFKRPLFGVIFQTPETAGYPHWGCMPKSMVEFASQQPGFLGVATEGPINGFSITMSFWTSEGAIKAWETQMENKPLGYKILVSKVDSDSVKKPTA